MKKLNWVAMCIACCFLCTSMQAQNTVTGMVSDAETGEGIIGAYVLVKGTVGTGTVTDYDGKYELKTSQELPFVIEFTALGYATQMVEITSPNQEVIISMGQESILADEVVVSASRVEENILQSPVSVEKIGLQEIKTSAAADFYDEINNMKGVIRTQASMTFNTVNTRGFATAGNTRFVQLQDGMDNAAPLLNFPTGNVVGISELDIKSVELVPGAASALYGPNAFNGILFMNSKDPWVYQGLSAQIKTGVAQSDETNPLYGLSLRYADQINDKLAYKFNVSTFFAEDWRAEDYDTHIETFDNSITPGQAAFNGVNLYGDETNIPVAGGMKRWGFEEQFLLDNNEAKSIKVDGALHYRLSDDLEANVSYKWGSGSSVYQGSERYALRDFVQQFAKFELNSNNWNIRAYGSFTDDGDSYNLSALGAIANETIWPSIYDVTVPIEIEGNTYPVPLSGGWAVAANLAAALPGASAESAQLFANMGGTSNWTQATTDAVAQILAGSTLAGFGALHPDLPLAAAYELINLGAGPSTIDFVADEEQLSALIEQVRTGLFQSGGAGFIDNSRMYHVEGNYDLSNAVGNAFGLQAGANIRRYSLFTDGTVFREWNPETMQNERITIDEYGGYLQASKSLLDEHLKFTGSIRYDKNENFEGQFSPRISAVYSMDENKKHNLRASWQTGFRNPTTQGQFIFFPASQLLLGGTESNAAIVNEADGTIFNIFEDGALALDGETMVDLDYVKPEQLTAIEVGYKGIIGGDLFLDVNYYHNMYEDFINQLSVLSTKSLTYRGTTYGEGTRFFPYTNVPIAFSSDGIDLGFRYRLNRDWSVNGNYSWAKVNFDQEKLIGTSFEGSNFDPGFNTPENKIGLGIASKDVWKKIGFGANYRWQQDFFYSSSFGNGQIPAYQTLDASLSYKLDGMKTLVKLGVTNLLKEEYVTNVGNPIIGRMIVLTLTYDQFGN